MAKEKVENQTTNLTLDQKKLGIDPIYLVVDDVRHTVGKLSTRATTLLETTPRSEVYSQSYRAPKLREKKVIWMWAPWRSAKYTIRGKVVASPKSGPW